MVEAGHILWLPLGWVRQYESWFAFRLGWEVALLCAIRLAAMAIEPATTTPLADRGGNNLSAMGYMLHAVLGFSLIPLFIDLVAGFQSPFMFNAWFRIGSSIGCLLLLLAYYPSTGLGRDSWTTIRSWIFGWPDNKLLLLATVVNLEYALFAWSLRL